MDVPRIFLAFLLLVLVCGTSSTLKNDRGGSSFSGRGPVRLSRRIALNEYLVPPPPPRQHPFRSGRLANPQPAEPPGYFSKFMNWLSPFGFGSPGSMPLKPPPYHEPSFPPPPQGHATPFNLHAGASHPPPPPHPPAGPPSDLPLYPPLNPPPGHPGPAFTPPLNTHPVLPLSSPPGQPAPLYKPPPAALHEPKHYLPPQQPKGKSCNPCNKVPWIPMQGSEHQPNQYPPAPQPSNGYLPPSNHGSHDAQYAASHDIRVPDFPRVQAQQNGQAGAIAPVQNPLLQPNPVPPLYSAEHFGQPSRNPPTEGFGLEPPPIPSSVLEGHFSDIGNHDQTSSGTQINQDRANVVPQSHGAGIDNGLNEHAASFGASDLDNQSVIYGTPVDQGYPEPLNHGASIQDNPVASFGSSDLGHEEDHGFASQNGDVYRESFEPNPGHDAGAHYLGPDLGPTSFDGARFGNQAAGNLNYQYSDDLSPSSSVVKDTRADATTKNESIYVEQSPLLDLTKESENRGEAQWQSQITTDGNALEPTTTYHFDAINTFLDNSSSFGGLTDSYGSSNHQDVDVYGQSTPSTLGLSENNEGRYTETATVGSQFTNQQDVLHAATSGQSGYVWTSLLLDNPDSKNESQRHKEAPNFEQQARPDSRDTNETGQKQQNTKRNKQVQVIIPYTSDYTPIPFQQSSGDWSVKNNRERTQPRKIPLSSDPNINDYAQQESRNDIRLINQLQAQFNLNDSYKTNIRMSQARLNDTRTIKANSSIDVRRLQKNIDNWTIQEYSKPTPSSTIVPSSSHPYLLPSKKIPTEYLTTTEPGDQTNESKDSRESVKSYSLAGFSFNEVDHEGSSSNHIETVQSPVQVVRVETSKSSSGDSESTNKATTERDQSWGGYSVTISPVNKEKIYVVTPQSVPATSPKTSFEKQKRENLQKTNQLNESNSKNSNDSTDGFDAIEKAYQVLPQAVNNLAVASTGKEEIPLWGIMEHEEFATLNLEGNDDEAADDVVDGPVLYTGHSKVSRAKR
nr:uncharacterized protein LOC117222873 [Megalopta genalis]